MYVDEDGHEHESAVPNARWPIFGARCFLPLAATVLLLFLAWGSPRSGAKRNERSSSLRMSTPRFASSTSSSKGDDGYDGSRNGSHRLGSAILGASWLVTGKGSGPRPSASMLCVNWHISHVLRGYRPGHLFARTSARQPGDRSIDTMRERSGPERCRVVSAGIWSVRARSWAFKYEGRVVGYFEIGREVDITPNIAHLGHRSAC
jgi:hypothetical protein